MFRNLRTAVVLLALSGCGVQPSTGGQQVSTEQTAKKSANAENDAKPAAEPKVDTAAITESAEPMSDVQDGALARTCGTSTMLIQCESGDENCSRTDLHLEGAGRGERKQIAMPDELKDYTAVGLGCAANTEGKSYFVVQFGELPYGCEFCEWFHLYDTTGQLLTHSIPPIIEDAELPGASDQMPNNREYEALMKKLGLEHPKIEYFEQSPAN